LILLALVLPAAAAPAHAPALAQSIARIALTQIGVADSPAVTSFSDPDCDPYSTLVGSGEPNADDCGLSKSFNIQDQNEPWCSDFVTWVWRRAGVTRDISTLNADASSFYLWGLEQHQRLRPDRGRPIAGDAAVFYPRGRITSATWADHVGIVVRVNRDGTVNLVNGDFLGPSNISVRYNERVHLTSWASRVWGRGEQWVLVAPPSGPQPAAPDLRVSGPRTAVVAGTSVSFSAYAPGPVSGYRWTFGDGREWNVSSRAVSHVFTQDGRYPVTVTASSPLGTATTRTLSVFVTGASSPVASVPDISDWYSPSTDTYLFRQAGGFRHAGGRLTAGRRDGWRWRYAAVPGRPDSGSGLTALSYPDPRADDAMTPHVYYMSHGLLSQTYLGRSSWTAAPLAGRPAEGSAIVALARASGPEVFYFGAGGQLRSSAYHRGAWLTSRVTGPSATTVGSLALGATVSGPELFYLHGTTLLAARRAGAGWRTVPVRSTFGVAPGSPLAAVSTSGYRVDVFFRDRRGNLAVAAQDQHGWAVSQLPGAPAGTSLMAAAYPLDRHSTVGAPTRVRMTVFYQTRTSHQHRPAPHRPAPHRPARHRPAQHRPARPMRFSVAYSTAVTYSAGHGWRSGILRGTLSHDEAIGLDSLSLMRLRRARFRTGQGWLARWRPDRTGQAR
jgi:PKD domain-containing protein/CHAP domain-containing protein